VRTLIVSDLHLGTQAATDVLRRPAALVALLAALDGVDRLVLLGDVVELRSGPVERILAAVRPVLEALGRALDGREVLLVPGNHDNALIRPWLQDRTAPLSLEQRVAPADASPSAALLAGMLGPGTVFAYPGVWLRDDVYATHGHYLDCHTTLPSFERLAIGATGRLVGARASQARRPDDYEALVAPVYALIHSVAQLPGRASAVDGGGSTRLFRALAPRSGRAGLPARALGLAFPLAIAGLNRAGLGPLRSDLSGDELRQGRLRSMGSVVEQLAIPAAHVIFGHTHRTGPLRADAANEWAAPGGARLHNCGSWVFDEHMMTRTPGESPYWPGGCVVVDDDRAPPRLERLLGGCSAAELTGR